jgi:acylphosphatase
VKTLRVRIEGRVQGVGFRWWVEEEARRRGLSGWVRNRRDGTVEAVFSGDDTSVDDMVAACGRGPPAARVDKVETEPTDEAVAGFRTLSTV